jgi:hypothetical protein
VSTARIAPGLHRPAGNLFRVQQTIRAKTGVSLTDVTYGLLWLFVFFMPLESALVLPGVGTLGRVIGLAACVLAIFAILDSGKVRSVTLPHILMCRGRA